MGTRLHQHIYLVGLMGAGKSSVGWRLARRLGVGFVDTDEAVEARTGVSVAHIFEMEGEEGFRVREAGVLAEVGGEIGGEVDGGGGKVVATGGGIVLREGNCRLLRETGRVVYLRASVGVLWGRLERGRMRRPLLHGAGTEEEVKRRLAGLLEVRAPIYEGVADWVVEVGWGSAGEVAREVEGLIRQSLGSPNLK